jgi:glycosyltransferase involved in cell wall biosynthesis
VKITFILPHLRISGGVKALLEYANRLTLLGAETLIVIPKKGLKWYRVLESISRARKGSISIAPESIDWFPNKVPILEAPKIKNSTIPDSDILIASSWETVHMAEQLSPNKGRKIYFVQHYETLWTRKKKEAEKTYKMNFEKIVISDWLQSILLEKFSQPSKVLVTPVDDKQFLKEEKNWNAIPKVCLMHHNYDWKGYDDGIESVRQSLNQTPNFQLTVFGEKIKDPSSLFQNAGFDFEYFYRPTGDAIRDLFFNCDIYLCPSWYEGLGMPAMEAMASRCALVTTDTGGSRNYAIHDQTALVSKPKDTKALSKNLSDLIENIELRKKLSANGFNKIKEFNWDKNCRQLLEVFEKSPKNK